MRPAGIIRIKILVIERQRASFDWHHWNVILSMECVYFYNVTMQNSPLVHMRHTNLSPLRIQNPRQCACVIQIPPLRMRQTNSTTAHVKFATTAHARTKTFQNVIYRYT